MSDRVETIRTRLTDALSPQQLDIQDDSRLHAGHAGAAGGAGHYSVRVVSEKFRDKNQIERHRMVYMAVTDMMPDEIHALSIKALTPEENQ